MAQAQAVTLSYEDGTRAVELARESVESYVINGQREQPGSMREAFYARTGVFVRLTSTRGRGRLRGCDGAYEGSDQLGHLIVDSAISAASDTSCGSEVEAPELPNLQISVCVVRDTTLTDDPIADIELGTHGVAIEGRGKQAWMYPTLPCENDWSSFEYLDRTCRKAGLPKGAWEDDDVSVTLFDGQVFREREPEGTVEELD
ncbi:TIGR00296 family protein [Halorussus amylolyticus]|uniref:TIGR00296 family protein n=1 Tax=Halorussus amylolyticus TaxID=1126242 RepID=UPI00104DE3AC|nr:TIGR00296 family protein [Halorussus amylolyticus]